MSEHVLKKYAENCEIVEEKMDAEQTPSDVVDFCFRLLSQARVTSFHILFIKVTESAFNNGLAEIEANSDEPDLDLLESTLFHGLNLVAGYTKFGAKSSPWSHLGDYLLKVAEIEFVLGNNADCKKHLIKAEEILAISNGVTESDGITTTISIDRIRKLLENL